MIEYCECANCYGVSYTFGLPCLKYDRIERELKILETKRLIAYCRKMAEIERKKVEQERKQREEKEEKERKKKRFYNFIFYASLLYLIVLKCKWDINNYLPKII